MNAPSLPSQAVSCAPPFRVLVVEDGKGVAEVMAMFFEMEGHKTAVAFDGIEAVETAEVFRPHLICMDLTMPRMDGFEAARRIRQMLLDVVIVALCGWDDEEVRHRTAEAGFNDHLAKPVTPDALRKMIGLYLPTRRETPPDPPMAD
jgi:CheY-like chemotaxis protein